MAIATYVSAATADVDVTLILTPQNTMSETGEKYQEIRSYSGLSESRISFNDQTRFIITLDYEMLSATDAATIMDIYCDSTKANGVQNSFKFQHPTDTYTYVVRFISGITRSYNP